MPGSIKIDDGSGNYTILTNAGSLGSDKTLTIPNTTGTAALTTDVDVVLLASFTASDTSEIDFTDSVTGYNNTDYSHLKVTYKNFHNASDSRRLLLVLYAGSTAGTGTYTHGGNQMGVNTNSGPNYYHQSRTNSADLGYLLIGNAANEGLSGEATIFPGDGTGSGDGSGNDIIIDSMSEGTSGLKYYMNFAVHYDSATAMTGCKLSADTGNIGFGVYNFYGYRK